MPESWTRRIAWLGDLVHVDELLRLLLDEEAPRLGHPDLPELGARGQHAPQHVAQVLVHLAHARPGEHLHHRHALGPHLQLDLAVVEAARAELLAELLPRGGAARLGGHRLQRAEPDGVPDARARQEELEEALLGRLGGPLGDALRHLALDHVDGELGQVADHRLHVPADVADLGVLRGLDLDERGLGEPGEPPGDLRLPDARRPDHDDVLRRHLVPELRREVLAPPAVPERDGDRPLRPALPDHVAVELDPRSGRE